MKSKKSHFQQVDVFFGTQCTLLRFRVKFVVQLTTNPQQTEVMEFKHATATLVRLSCETEKQVTNEKKLKKLTTKIAKHFNEHLSGLTSAIGLLCCVFFRSYDAIRMKQSLLTRLFCTIVRLYRTRQKSIPVYFEALYLSGFLE